MNLKFLLFLNFIYIIDGFMLKTHINKQKPYNKIALNGYGGNGNMIHYGGGGGGNDDDNDIRYLLLLNFLIIKKLSKILNKIFYDR